MHDVLELLASQLEERRKSLIESLGDGGPKTFDEYKYVTGVVRGLLMAQSSIADLAKHMENSDE